MNQRDDNQHHDTTDLETEAQTAAGPGAVLSAEEQVEAQERAERVLREHDTASRFRENLGWWRLVVFPIAAALTVFQLWTAFAGSRPTLVQGSIHVGAAMCLVFLLYPASKRMRTDKGLRWWELYDVVLAAAALAANLYIFFEYERLNGLSVQIHGYTGLDTIVAVTAIVLILEATRRCVGLPIVVIAVSAIAYAVFGNLMPVFAHRGYAFTDYATELFFTSRAVFGTPIQVSSTFIFLFLLFGVILINTNIGAFFNDLAYRATGKYAGGPAKAAVVASAMQGTVSGSSVANTVASGSFTIPMMKRAGFKPHFAAATEATASTGGQLMPPVMGAAVFIMAEYTGIAYRDIIIIALIPAILYFTGVFLGTHFEAKRQGIHGVPVGQLPAWKGLVKRLDLLLPLAVIVGQLLAGTTPQRAALYGIGTALVLSLLRKDTRMSVTKTLSLLEQGARIALPVIAACATAGIVAGTVTATGLGGALARGLVDLAQGQFILVLAFTMIACLLLGMGLPTTANYVVTATIAAPILLNQFDVPVIAAHLFVFYFGILADITPPVCLAAYAGSGIANANPMRSGVTALRLAIAGFIIPFIFVLEPALLMQQATLSQTALVVATSLIGMVALSSGVTGYLMRTSNLVERLILIATGLALIYPNIYTDLAALTILLIIGANQYRTRHNRIEPEPQSINS